MRVAFMSASMRKSAVLAVAVLIIAAAVCCGRAGASGPPAIDDQEICDAIDDEYLFDSAVQANDISVSSVDGIVTLRGTVDNILKKERAARIAETVKGVRSVVNRIEVSPHWNRMDWEIEKDAENALLFNAATESYEVEVSVQDNVATLTGTVDSWQEKELCETVVKGVKGVTGIRNDVDIDYHMDRSDREMKLEVEERLKWDVLVDDGLIDVTVKDGAVTLSGTVGSMAEKRQAAGDAWVGGVKSVDDDDLAVKMWARDERLRKDKYVFKSADEIENAIGDALLYDPRVLSTKVIAEASNGVVTMRGTVESPDAKRAAEQVARNTVGVIAVENRIKVRPHAFSDREIIENVRQALSRDPFVDRYEISVTAIEGVVYLDGSVDTYYEKSRADDAAARVVGVEAVINNLDVDKGAHPLAYDPYLFDYYFYDYDWYDYEPYRSFKADREIKEEIDDELFWSPFVDSDDVAVAVEDGVATLTGTVDSWSEFRAATENAYEGGAVWVDNDLQVK